MNLRKALTSAIKESVDADTLLYAQRDTDGDWVAKMIDPHDSHEYEVMEGKMTRIGEYHRSDIEAMIADTESCWDSQWDTPAAR